MPREIVGLMLGFLFPCCILQLCVISLSISPVFLFLSLLIQGDIISEELNYGMIKRICHLCCSDEIGNFIGLHERFCLGNSGEKAFCLCWHILTETACHFQYSVCLFWPLTDIYLVYLSWKETSVLLQYWTHSNPSPFKMANGCSSVSDSLL